MSYGPNESFISCIKSLYPTILIKLNDVASIANKEKAIHSCRLVQAILVTSSASILRYKSRQFNKTQRSFLMNSRLGHKRRYHLKHLRKPKFLCHVHFLFGAGERWPIARFFLSGSETVLPIFPKFCNFIVASRSFPQQ